MARTEAGATLTAEHRRAQLQIRAQALSDYTQLWPAWHGDDASFNTLVAAAIPLALAYYGTSVAVAAAYFDSYRRAERAGGAAPPRLAAPLVPDRLVASLHVTGRIQTMKALQAGQTPEAAMRTALVRTSGALTRHVLAGGRETIIQSVREDERAIGWARVGAGAPCPFCLMLIGRGAVYKDDTVGFQAHDHCACGAAPTYDGDPLPESARANGLYRDAQRWARQNPNEAASGTSSDALTNLSRYLARTELPATTGRQ